jgi:hypothetical protein
MVIESFLFFKKAVPSLSREKLIESYFRLEYVELMFMMMERREPP